MSGIMINHFSFKLIPTDIDLYISLDNHLFFKKKLAWFKEDFEKRNKLKLIGAWLDETEEVEDETDVFYGFEEPSAEGYYYLKLMGV